MTPAQKLLVADTLEAGDLMPQDPYDGHLAIREDRDGPLRFTPLGVLAELAVRARVILPPREHPHPWRDDATIYRYGRKPGPQQRAVETWLEYALDLNPTLQGYWGLRVSDPLILIGGEWKTWGSHAAAGRTFEDFAVALRDAENGSVAA